MFDSFCSLYAARDGGMWASICCHWNGFYWCFIVVAIILKMRWSEKCIVWMFRCCFILYSAVYRWMGSLFMCLLNIFCTFQKRSACIALHERKHFPSIGVHVLSCFSLQPSAHLGQIKMIFRSKWMEIQ